MEARGIRLQGERGISRQPIAQGMPECSGCTCMLVCVLFALLHTRPRVQQAPGIPCSLSCEGRNFSKARAQRVARTPTYIQLSSPGLTGRASIPEAAVIESRSRSVLDTRHRGHDDRLCAAIPPYYPSGVTEIRAQSRRPISTQSWVLRRSAMLTASQMPMAVNATVKASAAILASMR